MWNGAPRGQALRVPRRCASEKSSGARISWPTPTGKRGLKGYCPLAGCRLQVSGGKKWIVVKEPNGSVGATLLRPSAKRPCVAHQGSQGRSSLRLDRHRPGGGAYKWRKSEGIVRDRASRNPDAFIEGQAKRYMRNVGAAKRAYEAHEGPKVMSAMRTLRRIPSGRLRGIYSALGIPAGEDELARVW